MGTRAVKLLELVLYLKNRGYHFVTPTPETHRRFLSNNKSKASLRDIFGWNFPFDRSDLDPTLLHIMEEAEVLEASTPFFKSRVRFSSLENDLFVHGSYPTTDTEAVFFGPDTYRFTSLIRRMISPSPERKKLIDVGCGSGAGGIAAFRALGNPVNEVVFADINPEALRLARVNAALAGLDQAQFIQSDVLQNVKGDFDFILANPPYLLDLEKRAYRHGGGDFGEGLSARILKEASTRLKPGGQLILYTGTPVIDGTPLLLKSLSDIPLPFRFEELDPDVFGEELEKPYYQTVERIAVVSITLTLPLE